MANIFVRSPYIISIDEASQIGSKVEIFLWNNGTTEPTTPQYTLSKLIPSTTNTDTSYDISPYVREYISNRIPDSPSELSYGFTELNYSAYCNVKVKRYKLIGSTYTLLDTTTYYAFDGYTYYEDGYNYAHNNGNYFLEQKEYFYDDKETTYPGEVAMYLTAGQKIQYGTQVNISGVTVNKVLLYGTDYKITTLTKTGDYSASILSGNYLYFTYNDGYSNTSWTGTVLTCTYNSGTNTTTITPNFGIYDVIITGNPNNTNNRNLISGNIYIYPVSSTKWYSIPRVAAGLSRLSVLNSSFTELATWTFTPVCEPKYTAVPIDFINKYGAWQREFFFKASKNTLAIESSDYNVMQTSSGYDVMQGQKRTFNANARETISVNSGYVNEDFSSNIKQLIMSERIFVNDRPAICKTKSLEIQKNINNHMINYSLEFEFAYNTINNVI